MYIIYGVIYSTQDTSANVYYIGVLRLKKKSLHIGVYTNIILYCILKKINNNNNNKYKNSMYTQHKATYRLHVTHYCNK
jgi:hypothetical protein